MTDVSSVRAHAEPQPATLASPAAALPPTPAHGSPTPVDGTVVEEESFSIKCVCDYPEDDGNTVYCETCDTWQHIVCYYGHADNVPEVHECTDCHPRSIELKGAADKQRLRTGVQSTGERKGKIKTAIRNPKKRAKDASGAVQPNGWPANNDAQYNPDRKSGSPRDQPPPNKRPKTNHRSSASVNVISQAPSLVPTSRKRGASILINGHSPVKSPTNPDGLIEDYSHEFMNLYRNSEPPIAKSNSYTRIEVANDIAMWLTDPEALAEASRGKKPQDLFSRIEVTIQELEQSTAPEIVKQTEIETGVTAHGLNPQWQFITVESPVAEGGYIGELKGLIGRQADYYLDPANRWEPLQHPEPFVFFTPHLPIYIDTRREGNILRYARRSCLPNMTMKILIESSNDYHFCFLATRQIDPGEELTVGWDIGAEVHRQLAKVVSSSAKEGFRKIQPWVSCVLANFGGCACDRSTGYECLLERARRPAAEPKTKVRKTKKLQISPLSTGRATNSRAGSETLHRDMAEDDQMDAQSTSGSRKSSSRDITPATHFSVDGDLKMSDREKRKLQQQERLFEQLEFDEQQKGKKGKRISAGFALHTPNLASSVSRSQQSTTDGINESIQRRIGHPEPSPSSRHREHSHGVARKTSGGSTRTTGRGASRPKPVYKDVSTQTDMEGDVKVKGCNKHREMRPPLSFKRKLLQQAQEDKLQRERLRSTSVKAEIKSPVLKDVASSKPSPLPPSPPLDEPTTMDITLDSTVDPEIKALTPVKEPTPTPTIDVEMEDAEDAFALKEEEPREEASREEDPREEELREEGPKEEELREEGSRGEGLREEEPTEKEPPEKEPPEKEPPDAPVVEISRESSHPSIQPPIQPPVQPPALPWTSTISNESSPTSTTAPIISAATITSPVTDSAPNIAKLRIETAFPPEPSTATYSEVTPVATSTVAIETPTAQSPTITTAPSPFSPAVTNALKPTPARKKVSLSDYTNRRAKLAQTQTSGSTSFIFGQSQSTSSPTLSVASLPNVSPPPKTSETATANVTEESTTIDATPTTAATAAVSTSASS